MANQTLIDKTATTALSSGDLIYVLRDPGGTPVDRKMDVDDLFSSSIDFAPTGAVDLSSASSFTTISGSWTPTIYGVTTPGSPTGTFEGTYSIFSNDEFVYRGRILLTSKGGMSGAIRIGGFPFNTVANNASRATVSIGLSSNYTLSAGEILTADVTTGVNYMRLDKASNTGTSSTVADTEITDSFLLYFEIRGRIA